MAKKPTEEETVELDPVDAAAAAEVASMTPAEAPKGISEEEIAEKTRAGLTRDQAIEVIGSQRAWDKRQKK